MNIDPQTVELVVQVISTAGLSIMGVRGMITALSMRVEKLEIELNDLRARYIRANPVE